MKLFQLLLLLFILNGCRGLIVENISEKNNIEDFDLVWNFIDDVYPYFELKEVDWSNIYDEYNQRYFESAGDDKIEILVDLLSELKDGHTYVETIGGEKIFTCIPPRRLKDQYTYSPLLIREYFPDKLITTGVGGLEYGILPNNIGYIYIGSFGSALNFVGSIQAALNYVMNTNGLIIDVRHNKGGDGINAVYLVSRFLLVPVSNLDTYVLGELKEGGLIDPSNEMIYTNDVAVLINGVSYSATESFAEIMKQVPNVTVVGDTTGGGSAGYYGNEFPASGDLILSDGIKVHVGTIDIRRLDGLPFEDIGIYPDVTVVQTEQDIINGHDLQLEAAIEVLIN